MQHPNITSDDYKVSSAHTRRGKWSQLGVPKRGWSCVGVEDMEEPSQLCEMCESIAIRYLHHMEHPEYPEILAVGCVCAEHLEQNYVRPREREKLLKNSSRRRKSWVDRVWKVSAKGNNYINTDGFNITVFQLEGAWKLAINSRKTGNSQTGRKTYATKEAAKAAGFDALIWARETL